jgi:DNA modification methylase
MKPELKQIKLSEIVFDQTVYPRSEHNPSKVQEYADNMEAIESAENYIVVDSRNKLLDGRHRHLAYLTNADGKDINITVYIRTDIVDDKQALIAGIEYNNSHGQQLSSKDKKRMAMHLYSNGYTVELISKNLSMPVRTVTDATKEIRARQKEERKEKIFSMYLACHTQEEIAEEVGVTRDQVQTETESLCNLANLPKSTKLSAEHESDFDPPIYNIWNFAKKTNDVSHFGNTEQRIVDNLLYLYTSPFDIVVDPFAGGGSTIDVCKKRLRRYYISDRKPIEARKHEIRKLDITDSLPALNKRWSDVSLVYLDPPYWKQAENQYSTDAEDLANQTADKFHENMIFVIDRLSDKMHDGSHIAMIISPTQWSTNDDHDVIDHMDTIRNGINKTRLKFVNKILCPYSTEQYNGTMVNIAKQKKLQLVLTRELIIWKVTKIAKEEK